MELALKNYNTKLPSELLLKAKKSTVRECDEIEKGHYQAYVDENDKTFDTYLKLNSKGEVTGHGCDCQSTTAFCHHQTALLLFVIKGKKVVTKLNAGKKAIDIETIVQDADPEKLKTWLIELLTKNKDLGMTFIYQFSRKTQQPAELKQLTLDAVKAIIKTKRSIDNLQAKKIIGLWAVLHEPVMSDFSTQLANEESFLSVHAVMEACEHVRDKYGSFNDKLPKYQEKLMLHVLSPLHQLKDEELWDQVIARISERLHGGPYYVRMYYLNFLSQLHRESTLERKKRLTALVITQFMTVNARQFFDGSKYIIVVFDMVASSDLFEEYGILFEPLRYENNYNHKLIAMLMEYQRYALAEKYCQEQIAGNSNGIYNYPYLQLLEEIYTIEKDDEKLAAVLKASLPHTYDFNTYLFVDSQLEESEEKRNWRNQLLAGARREASTNHRAMMFSLQLMDHEQNYTKMFDYLDTTANYEALAKFGEKLVLHDEDRFLTLILFKYEPVSEIDTPELIRLTAYFEAIFNICVKHFSIASLKLIIEERLESNRFYAPNQLVIFMTNKLDL